MGCAVDRHRPRVWHRLQHALGGLWPNLSPLTAQDESRAPDLGQNMPVRPRNGGRLDPAHDFEIVSPPVSSVRECFEITRDVMTRSIRRESEFLLVKLSRFFLRRETSRQSGYCGEGFLRAILAHLRIGVAQDHPGHQFRMPGCNVVGNKPTVQPSNERRPLDAKSFYQPGDVGCHGRRVIAIDRAITVPATAKIGNQDFAIARKSLGEVTHAVTGLQHAMQEDDSRSLAGVRRGPMATPIR